VTGVVLIPLLYGLAGAVVSLFVFTAVLWEVLNGEKRWYASLLYVTETAIIAVLSVRFAHAGEYRMVLLPDLYYEPLVHVRKIYLSWYALPGCIVVARLLRSRKWGTKSSGICYAVSFFSLFGLLYLVHTHYARHTTTGKYLEMDYHTRMKAWDKVIATFSTGE
jgi:hypothetical protein